MRVAHLVLAVGVLLTNRTAAAQTPVVLAPGTRIRFTLPPAQPPIVGEVSVQRGDSVWVREAGKGNVVDFTIPMLERLEVAQGRERHFLAGAGIGLLTGGVLGAVIGSAAGNDCSKPGPYPNLDLCLFPKDETTLITAAYLGGFGAAVGGLIGWLHQTDHWVPVALPPRVGMVFERTGRGYRVGMRYTMF